MYVGMKKVRMSQRVIVSVRVSVSVNVGWVDG